MPIAKDKEMLKEYGGGGTVGTVSNCVTLLVLFVAAQYLSIAFHCYNIIIFIPYYYTHRLKTV